MTRLVIALVLLASTVAYAQEAGSTVTYKVRQGDNLEVIAAEHYGDRTKAVFIMQENKILHPRPLRPGERLRIPISRPITTAPGDSFQTLAGTHLGNSRRAPFLADFNAMNVDDTLPAGIEILIPFSLTHVAAATETLDSIAAAYFGDTKNADMLRRYNFLEKDALDKGEAIQIPITNLRLQASKMPAMDAESKKRRDRQAQAMARALRALPIARQAWHDGDYAGVKAALAGVELDIDYLEAAEAVEVGVLVGAVHVAYNDTQPAIEAFKRVTERKAGYQLNPYYFSPKIMAVWAEAHPKP